MRNAAAPSLVAGRARVYLENMSSESGTDTRLTGQLLVAMPGMADPRFVRSVVYLCVHSAEGAMGLIVNKRLENVSFAEIAGQVGIEPDGIRAEVAVHYGGPVETGRGFVLHSTDCVDDTSLVIDERFALTATVEMLRTIAAGSGPGQRMLALGYAGWSAGQLDAEIQANGWLTVPADPAIVFDADDETKWERALRAIGIDPSLLSVQTGRA